MNVGFGAAPITPTPPVYLAGFGARTEPARAVHDDLEARAIYLAGGSSALCLVVCDLLGMTPDVSTPIRRAIAERLDLDVANVLVACIHTHSGPSVITGSDALGWPTPDGYVDLLRDGCLAAAVEAAELASETTLRFGRAALPDGFAFNRRGLPYEQPTFAVLRADGIGVVANLGIHPVLLGPEWLAVATDWVGPFRNELDRLLGGMAIQLTGALGDVNPTPPAGEPEDTYAPWASGEQTASYGKALASVVAAAVVHAEPIEPTLRVLKSETIEVPVGGTPIAAMLGEPTMRVDLVEWQIGDVHLVSIPGEAFHLLGRELSSSRNDRVLLAGISPSWHGYLPHPWGDGYEEGVSYGEPAVTAIREALLSVP